MFNSKKSTCKRLYILRNIVLGLLILALIGCGGGGSRSKRDGAPKRPPRNLDKVPNAVPKAEPLAGGNHYKKGHYVAKNRRYRIMSTSKGYRARGLASWYGTKFHGRKTSSGEKYDMYSMTAAHRTLPLPTYAKVTNLENGKSVIVKVNDRGPFHKNRLIDVSYVAAHKLGMLGKGTSRVHVESVDPRDHHGFVHKRRPLMAPPRKLHKTKLAENPARCKFYVQMGRFTQKTSALTLANKVGKISKMPTQIAEYRTKKQPFFKVRIGPISNQEEAAKLSKMLTSTAAIKSTIISE